jgi:Uma2 family endonuclease
MSGKVTTIIRPSDQGRRMSLEEFEHAEAEGERLYELSRGVITVVDVPKPRHQALIHAIRRQLHAYDAANPGRIQTLASGGECKLLIPEFKSERHPDLAIYKTPPPEVEDDHEVWSRWVPEIVVEVVSPSSRQRDYEEKPEEYLRLGIGEYWIVDAEQGLMKVLRRSRGRWVELTVRPPAGYKTRLLPRFDFSIARLLEAVSGHDS